MAGHFTHRLYFHSPAARENMVACSSPYHTLTHVISIIYKIIHQKGLGMQALHGGFY